MVLKRHGIASDERGDAVVAVKHWVGTMEIRVLEPVNVASTRTAGPRQHRSQVQVLQPDLDKPGERRVAGLLPDAAWLARWASTALRARSATYWLAPLAETRRTCPSSSR